MAYIFKSISAKGQLCTKELFLAATHDDSLLPLYQQIASEPDNNRRGLLKKRLPGITWQADFPKDGRRKNAEAVATGYYIIDIDHIDKPEALYQEKIAYRLVELGVMAVHETPSRHGLRVVARCRKDCHSIAENQRWFAAQTGVEIDAAVKDLARFSFLVPHDYFYYLDENIWTLENVAWGNELDGSDCQGGDVSGNASTVGLQTQFNGLALTDIAKAWIDANGGMPEQGERNTVLHRLAYDLRYITDFNPVVIAAAIPHCGLADAEIDSLCQSACNAPRSKAMPGSLKTVLARMGMTEMARLSSVQRPVDGIDDDPHDEAFLARMPKLPVGLKESLEGVPDKVKMPIVCGLMPLAMSYATRVKVRYCDGRTMRLNGMCVIYGKQASGKSSVKDVLDVWMKPMMDADAEVRKREDEFKQLKKNRKANEKLPEEPHEPIVNVPVTISCSTLLKRLKNAADRHLFSFGEELDTLRKTNGAGSWSSKYDVYRLSFDNGIWGQDYNSDNAESGVVAVAYNWTVLGTQGAVGKCFRNDNIENGMGGRVLFSKMPSRKFEYMPTYHDVKPVDVDKINEAVHILANSHGFVDTPLLCKTMKKWCNDKADEARALNDEVEDIFRKRAAVIGFRCGVVFHLLASGNSLVKLQKESKGCLDFAVLMAEYALKYQCELFGQQMVEALVNQSEGYRSKNKVFFDSLPKSFNYDVLQGLRPDAKNNALRQMVHRWNRMGLIVEVGKGTWEKRPAD